MRKTRYKSRESIFKRRWKKGWGGRGITVMNDMEIFELTKRNEKNGIISTRDKLGILLKIYQTNRFYHSLRSQIQRGHKLSRKQVQIIEDDFKNKIKGVEDKAEESATVDSQSK
jgi:hypothetical protein